MPKYTIEEQIINKLKKTTSKKFTKDSNFKDIGIDSLDLLELVTEAEKFFNINISDEELTKIKTVNDFIKLVQKLVLKQ